MAQWKYSKSFYDDRLDGTGLEIRTHPVKGKGLFTTAAVRRGEIVLEETALCCSQNLDDAARGIPVCAHCLKSLETPRRIVARLARSKQAALQLPFPSAAGLDRPVHCRFENEGCHVVFCSARCREAGWALHHAMLCRGKMKESQRTAYDSFLDFDWVQNGVDYSDTAFLALRMVAQAISAHRLNGESLDCAFAPYLQLVSAPLNAFYFPYLLANSASDSDSDKDADAAVDATTRKEAVESERSRYDAFQRLKEDPLKCGAVKESYASGRTKEAFCHTTAQLVASILLFNTVEAKIVTDNAWSEFLGAVLLNGQERSPPSSYDVVSRMVRLTGVEKSLDMFEATLARDYHVNVDDLYYSTRGQGIYTIGCLFNHSCEPNIEVVYSSADDETLTVIATRDVSPGEELCISYVATDLPVTARQQQLYEHYLFECLCPRCELEVQKLKAH